MSRMKTIVVGVLAVPLFVAGFATNAWSEEGNAKPVAKQDAEKPAKAGKKIVGRAPDELSGTGEAAWYEAEYTSSFSDVDLAFKYVRGVLLVRAAYDLPDPETDPKSILAGAMGIPTDGETRVTGWYDEAPPEEEGWRAIFACATVEGNAIVWKRFDTPWDDATASIGVCLLVAPPPASDDRKGTDPLRPQPPAEWAPPSNGDVVLGKPENGKSPGESGADSTAAAPSNGREVTPTRPAEPPANDGGSALIPNGGSTTLPSSSASGPDRVEAAPGVPEVPGELAHTSGSDLPSPTAAPLAPATPTASPAAAPTAPTAPTAPAAPIAEPTPDAATPPAASVAGAPYGSVPGDLRAPTSSTSKDAGDDGQGAAPPPAPAPSNPAVTSGAKASLPAADARPESSTTTGSSESSNESSAGLATDSQGRRSKKSASTSDWRVWWDANSGALRETLPARPRWTPGHPLRLCADDRSATGGDAATRDQIVAAVLPALRRSLALAGPSAPETCAAALLALARTSEDPMDAERIAATLRDRNPSDRVHEAAAVALGSFRRETTTPAFDGAFYDRMRALLLDVLSDDSRSERVRSFAAMAIGLLGDQPGASGDAFTKDGRATIRRLWARLQRTSLGADEASALLVALSLQNAAGVPSGVREGLRSIADGTDRAGARRSTVVRSNALLALAALAPIEAVELATTRLSARSEDGAVRRAATVALGLAGAKLDASVPRERAIALLLGQATHGDPATAGLAAIAIARLATPTDAESLDAGWVARVDALAGLAERGAAGVRPFAAIAVGLATRPRGDVIDSRLFVDVRARALDRLRAVYADAGQDPALRSAFAIGLALAADASSRTAFESVVADASAHSELAAYSCTAIGLLGSVPSSSLAALRAAASRAPGSSLLESEAAKALGVLGDSRAISALIARSAARPDDVLFARAVNTLATLGGSAAARLLCEQATRQGGTDVAKALACTGLGMLADAGRANVVSRLRTGANDLVRPRVLEDALWMR